MNSLLYQKRAAKIRQRLKRIVAGLINFSVAQSNFSVRSEVTSSDVIFHLPQGRICTSGMSNLGLDLDFPQFISNPIRIQSSHRILVFDTTLIVVASV